NCTISGNTGDSDNGAGGIFNRGTLTVINSTISGNTNNIAFFPGTITVGGIANVAYANQDATLMLLNCTIANNTVSRTDQTASQLFSGRLPYTATGTGKATIELRNTIISGDRT